MGISNIYLGTCYWVTFFLLYKDIEEETIGSQFNEYKYIERIFKIDSVLVEYPVNFCIIKEALQTQEYVLLKEKHSGLQRSLCSGVILRKV